MKYSRILLGALAAIGLSSGLQADEIRGVVQATTFAAMPDGGAVAIQSPDNSREAYEVRNSLMVELANRGFSVAPDAPIVLTFRVVEIPKRRTTAVGPIVDVRGRSGNDMRSDSRVLFRIPVNGDDREHRQSDYVLEIVVEDAAAQQLWQAEARASGAQGDIFNVAPDMVQAMLDLLGKDSSGHRIR